jgi:hypothetical protein
MTRSVVNLKIYLSMKCFGSIETNKQRITQQKTPDDIQNAWYHNVTIAHPK